MKGDGKERKESLWTRGEDESDLGLTGVLHRPAAHNFLGMFFWNVKSQVLFQAYWIPGCCLLTRAPYALIKVWDTLVQRDNMHLKESKNTFFLLKDKEGGTSGRIDNEHENSYSASCLWHMWCGRKEPQFKETEEAFSLKKISFFLSCA